MGRSASHGPVKGGKRHQATSKEPTFNTRILLLHRTNYKGGNAIFATFLCFSGELDDAKLLFYTLCIKNKQFCSTSIRVLQNCGATKAHQHRPNPEYEKKAQKATLSVHLKPQSHLSWAGSTQRLQ